MKRISQRGGRVFLRAARRADRDDVLRLNRASLRFYRGLVMPPVTARAWSAYLARRRRPDSPGFLICRAGDGAIVGGINVNEIVRGIFRSGYLGYQIGAAYARRGYMTEALAPCSGRPSAHSGSTASRRTSSRAIAPLSRWYAAPDFDVKGSPLPQDRRPLAGPRALGAHDRGVAPPPNAPNGNVR